MPTNKRHLLIDQFSSAEDFKSRKIGRSSEVPQRDRKVHGNRLLRQYEEITSKHSKAPTNTDLRITEESGVYVKFIGMPNLQLPLNSLDNKDFKLRTCTRIDERDIAIVFVPEERRDGFKNKIAQYLDPTKDGKNNTPRNHNLIDSIESIELANLREFWTDDPSLFPNDPDQEIWWEVWLKNYKDKSPKDIGNALANSIGGVLGNTSLSFFDNCVILIKASSRQLEKTPELISTLEELRKAKDTPNVLVESSPKEQLEWTQNLMSRIDLSKDSSTSIAILDTGVNYNHPLLSHFCSEQKSERWDQNWQHYDEKNDHASRQAGLSIFGDLTAALLDNAIIHFKHHIESARILPPNNNQNAPELYGAITTGTARKLETANRGWRRVYSLAVTAPSDQQQGGFPTSWSSEIDLFSSGFADDERRLFIISAGNNIDIQPSVDYWDQLHLAEIEDPAQAWNALTVGAYTEKTTNDDTSFDGWAPFAKFGDVAPSSRSSVNWAWKKQAPYKPDLVAEGGNRLLSQDKSHVTNADSVSLLTTSGKAAGQLFEVSSDTSAACALVSRQAAILMAEYPEYWPETIRGLLVHTADWTARMEERFRDLCKSGKSPYSAKEIMLRSVGYGVTNLQRACYSASNKLTLIAQDSLQPFIKTDDATDPKLNEMRLYELPWPREELLQLPTNARLKVTLSYYVEPNPSRRGYRQRYSYQSHGLRFEVIGAGQSIENFKSSINALATDDTYKGPTGDRDGWKFGPRLRTRGSLHSDCWEGEAALLADMKTIAVYPVGGWWKYRTSKERWKREVRYSLIVSIEVPDEKVDIYSAVENLVRTEVPIEN